MTVAPMVRQLTVPKLGSSRSENEDRAFVRTKRHLLVGLADGATESALSGEWAEVLVTSSWKSTLLDKYSRPTGEVPPDIVTGWLEPLRAQFTEQHARKERPWYAREKLRQGAHATLLVFRLFPGGRWKAAACGDACLLQVAGNDILHAFPVCSANAFTNSPALITSLPESPPPRLVVDSGDRLGGQTHFVFATDAMAAWLLDARVGADRMERLLQCESDEMFARLVEEERNLGALRNDDSTVVVIPF